MFLVAMPRYTEKPHQIVAWRQTMTAACASLAMCLPVCLQAEEGEQLETELADESGGWTDLPIEVHGFTSIGYFLTGDNEWIDDDSTEGSDEFWEFGVNVTARPWDRWRFGGQVFARDLGIYDNGRLQLDWLYADYRLADELGIQAGRVKIPYGLYNDLLDLDSGRTPVFLPQSIYALRLRDLQISVDGAKAYGYKDFGASGGGLEYIAYFGEKKIDDDSSTAQVLRNRGFDENFEIDIDYRAGGMLHWDTPVDGLGLRATFSYTRGLDVSGTSSTSGSENRLDIEESPSVVLSAEYQLHKVTLAAEWSRTDQHGDLSITIPPSGTGPPVPIEIETPFRNDALGWYVSADWHVQEGWDIFTAIDVTASDTNDFDDPERSAWRYVLATRYSLLENFSIKAEGQYIDGSRSTLSGEDGGEKNDEWWMLAFKTTVDF